MMHEIKQNQRLLNQHIHPAKMHCNLYSATLGKYKLQPQNPADNGCARPAIKIQTNGCLTKTSQNNTQKQMMTKC